MRNNNVIIFVFFILAMAILVIFASKSTRKMPPMIEPKPQLSVTPDNRIDCHLLKNYKQCYQVKE